MTRKREQGTARYLADLLARLSAAVPSDSRIADLGCGHGFELAALQARGVRAIGVDLSHRMRAP
ncbi:MAG: methyltransferase domain-containing protein [Streptomycetales bacterium]